MLMGTGSDVGKSLLLAGLCRAYHRRGLAVRPFKPQNMSNNAAVTPEGGEIGRAQALQARAAGLAPSVHMNPVLLKPESQTGAQVVVQGQVWGRAKASEYQSRKGQFMTAVLDSFTKLSEGADLLLVEGAGSASEINLRAGDIANWGFACESQTPVVLVGDIDRGGVIASLVGTAAVIAAKERDLLMGFVINKFRGDLSLFDSGLDAITARTALPSFGVLPFWPAARDLPAEDAVVLDAPMLQRQPSGERLKVAVLAYPRISNFDDFDPLAAEPRVNLRFFRKGEVLPGDLDWIILPGSKATRADLAALYESGWHIDLAAHARRRGRILGVCGGYQMLGRAVHDPDALEGEAGSTPGLGLLDIETHLVAQKRLDISEALHYASGTAVQGYLMHKGVSKGADTARPLFHLGGKQEGASSADGRILGTYLHGLFASDAFRDHLMRLDPGSLNYEAQVEARLDALAEHLEGYLDLDGLLAVASQAAAA